MTTALDVTAAMFKADPFPYYARLREHTPVVRVDVPGMGPAWLITRYDDVVSLLKDDRLVKDPANALTPAQLRRIRKVPKVFAPLQRGLLDVDGNDHTRMRALVRTAFTPRRVEEMRDQAQVLADQLLAVALRRGRMDVIADYALPIPLTLIARILGVPERDNARFSAWSTALITAPSNPMRAVPSVWRFLRYLRGVIAERARHPTDDLISALMQAREGQDRLSPDEIVAMVVLLLTAGHETTVNLIASGTLALLEHPDQAHLVREDPVLTGSAIEELVRYVVPAETATQRYTREEVTVAGVRIPQGELVLAVLGSANRDPAWFDDPEALDVTRAPNRHLSFGQGAHYCLGAPLARLEAQIAIPTLLRRAPNLQLAVPRAELRWRGGLVLRGLESLPVLLN